MFGLFQTVPQCSATEIQRRLGSAEPPCIVDVREPYEFAQGRIPGALPIPLGEIMTRQGELPKDRELVMVCRSGSRSGMAAKALHDAGFRVSNMTGGMLDWRGPVER